MRNHRIPRLDGTIGVILSTSSLRQGCLQITLEGGLTTLFVSTSGVLNTQITEGYLGTDTRYKGWFVCVYSGSSCLKVLPRVRGRSLTQGADSTH